MFDSNKIKQINKKLFTPLYVQIGDSLIEYIKENNLKPGDLIPSEHQLMEHFNVSQLTVRHALQRLVTNGYIIRHQGKGSFVAPTVLKDKLDIQSLEERFSKQGYSVTNVLLESG
jgi:GntR family transcriptional regulator